MKLAILTHDYMGLYNIHRKNRVGIIFPSSNDSYNFIPIDVHRDPDVTFYSEAIEGKYLRIMDHELARIYYRME